MKKYFLALVLFSTFACSKPPEEEPKEVAKTVKVITLESRLKDITFSFPGRVSAGKEATLTFKVSGRLAKLPVKEGQQIKKGALVAQLDQKDYRFEYQRARATFRDNQAAFKRAQALIKNKFISQADFDEKRSNFEVSQADLNIARTNLGYTRLTAPFTGKVARVYVDNFQNVQAKEDIIILQNLDEIEIKFFIPEKLAIQQLDSTEPKIEVVFDANPANKYSAIATEISTQADEQTQTYETTVRLPRPTDINVLPGMTAVTSISIEIDAFEDECEECFSIPANAIFSDSAKNTYVWVVNDDSRLEKREVVTAAFQEQNVLIEKGLQKGEKIVIAGVNFLRSDQLVRAQNNNNQ